jgi:tRNA 2-selenouridine synthase
MAPGAVLVDLRAPAEFADDCIPGAVNVPLFEDVTRSFVGLLYKQFSPEAAFQEGRAAVAERVEGLVAEIAAHAGWDVPEDDLMARVLAMTDGGIAKMEAELTPTPIKAFPAAPVILHCARGGMRSRSVVALLRALGFDRAVGLRDGYRGYRRIVMASLDEWSPPSRVVSLRGLTGVGKTLVLRAIEEMRPGWTLDLEGLAGHRSSLLGMVGLKPVSQKAFETALCARAAGGFPSDVMIVEGESRKVGDAIIPSPVWEAMRGATNIDVTASIARRVAVLSDDYLRDESALPVLREQLEAVSARMDGRPELAEMLDRGETGPLVELLLERYYDPLYRRSDEGKEYALAVDAEDEHVAAERVIAAVESGELWSD